MQHQKRIGEILRLLTEYYTPHFPISEMIQDSDAERRLLKYFPSKRVLLNQEALCRNILEPLWNAVNKVPDSYEELKVWRERKIWVLSGYRPAKVNRNIPGSSRDHETGEAANIRIYDMMTREMAMLFLHSDWPFDRIVIAYPDATLGGWLHVSHKRKGVNRRKVYVKYDTDSSLTELDPSLHDLRVKKNETEENLLNLKYSNHVKLYTLL